MCSGEQWLVDWKKYDQKESEENSQTQVSDSHTALNLESFLVQEEVLDQGDNSQTQESEKESQIIAFATPSNKDKKTRFRFTEKERVTALKELFNILCEDGLDNEPELWDNLRSVLIHDNRRFKSCTVRLLRDHMLEQVAKFKKYDAEEATESGKERVKTEWGKTMRMLLTVWTNYEHIVSSSTQKSCAKGGRPRKGNTNQKDDATAAKAIRDAALQIINENIEVESETIVPDGTPAIEMNDLSNETNLTRDHNYADAIPIPNNTNTRKHTVTATKFRSCGKNDDAFLYLAEKATLENAVKKEQLRLERQKHEDNLELQRDELSYKRRKLEFEERKWMEEAEQRKLELQKNEKLTKMLCDQLSKK